MEVAAVYTQCRHTSCQLLMSQIVLAADVANCSCLVSLFSCRFAVLCLLLLLFALSFSLFLTVSHCYLFLFFCSKKRSRRATPSSLSCWAQGRLARPLSPDRCDCSTCRACKTTLSLFSFVPHSLLFVLFSFLQLQERCRLFSRAHLHQHSQQHGHANWPRAAVGLRV